MNSATETKADDQMADEQSPNDPWADYFRDLLPLGQQALSKLSIPDDPQLEQELYRHIYLILAQNFGALVYQDSEYPDFWPMFSTMNNFAITNADDSYYMTPLKQGGVYKLTGFRGSSFNIDFQVGSEHFFYTGLGVLGPPLANYDIDKSLTIAADGSFEFILSEKTPEGYEGDWLYLDPKGTHLLVRQVFYDWHNEKPGRFSIERLDIPAARPRDSAAKIESRLSQVVESTSNWINFVLNHTANLRQRGVINQMAVRDFSQAGGVASQVYMDGLFDLQDDEALILELDIPADCYYWGFVIYDELWHIIDWVDRISSINGRAAYIDDDGKFRLVISSQDPGTANWLDAAGYQRGGLFGRFKQCPGTLKPEMIKVKTADISESLPADTPVVTLEQREQILRDRRRSIQMRQRW